MALHLVKLCVGAESVQDLEEWIAQTLAARQRNGEPVEQFHTTRMVPTRMGELLDGGSLYWVIKGEIACRQRLCDIRPFVDPEGIRRCRLILDSPVVRVDPRPRGPFQGWRYLAAKEAPADLGVADASPFPEKLRKELRTLGLL